MTPAPHDAPRDPLAAYLDGDPAAVRAAAPREPRPAQWDAVQSRIHTRLNAAAHAPPRRAWRTVAAVSAVLTAAAVAWVAFTLNRPTPQTGAPEVARPAPHTEPAPSEPDALPMAAADDVVLHRVPGDGWFPVGAQPLPTALSFASADDVELDDPNPAWPSVTLSPGDVPMIFAAKPR